jgi:putative transposase
MPRHARSVFPGLPHHVTQRGNRREAIFFAGEDRTAYLDWLGEYADRDGVAILAYCLMSNHVHIVLVPPHTDSLERLFRSLHTRYALRVNRIKQWQGHVWQGRYFSAPLDETYLWAAIRYVERNPVRAGLVSRAEDYPWSSASAHCRRGHDALLCDHPEWTNLTNQIADWSRWLAENDDPAKLTVLRRNAEIGVPCGTSSFIGRLERESGRDLLARPRGRPRKSVA